MMIRAAALTSREIFALNAVDAPMQKHQPVIERLKKTETLKDEGSQITGLAKNNQPKLSLQAAGSRVNILM